jgi:hypothetical protein
MAEGRSFAPLGKNLMFGYQDIRIFRYLDIKSTYGQNGQKEKRREK